MLTSVTLPRCAIGDHLLGLRREMAWDGLELNAVLHATEDKQAVRDRVFTLLSQHAFHLGATVSTEANAYARVRDDPGYVYKLAWYLHLKHVIPRVVASSNGVLLVGATFGTNKRYALLHAAIKDVVEQVSRTAEVKTADWAAAGDPCLQVANYCCWAIQRKWERGDERSYALIRDKIQSGYRAF